MQKLAIKEKEKENREKKWTKENAIKDKLCVYSAPSPPTTIRIQMRKFIEQDQASANNTAAVWRMSYIVENGAKK